MRVVLLDEQGYEEARIEVDDDKALHDTGAPKAVAFFKDHPYVRARHRDEQANLGLPQSVAYSRADYFVIEATAESGIYLLDP